MKRARTKGPGKLELDRATGPDLAGSDIQDKLMPLYRAVGHLIRRLDQRISVTFDRKMTGMRLTRTQFVLLIVAALVPGLEQAEMAVLASLDPATTGVVLRRLEQMGLVERVRSPRSRRGFLVGATTLGDQMIKKHLPMLDTVQSEILSPLTKQESEVFLHLLGKLVGLPDEDGANRDLG